MRFRFRLPRENRRTWFAAATLSVVALLVAAYAYHQASKSTTANYYNPHAAFQTGPTSSPASSVGKGARFLWPIYGFNDARTRVFSGGPAWMNTPSTWQVKWKLSGNAPLEFPPDIYGNAAFFMDDHATVNKINLLTGHRYWRYQPGVWSAASPALDPKLGLLYVPVLSKTSDSPGNGAFVAISMKSGKPVWSDPLPPGSESSPLIWGQNVYFGDSGGTVHDVNAKTGATIWTFPTSAPVKGGPTLHAGVLYFGNYAGEVYAVNARTGHQLWSTNIGPNVYASPTYAYGRLYVGNTSGGFYSLEASSGAVAWSFNTGNYVYSSAAVDNVPGLGPTVYFGSYNGHAYAVNAQSGHIDWEQAVGGSISGAASIVNNTVFFSSVYTGHNLTRGYNVASGAQDFSFNDGAYTATVASPKAVLLSGHYVLYGFFPKK